MTTPQDAGRSSHRRLDVQGLRAIAVGSVVAYHAGLPVPGGFVGVDVFFVISGYVITAMLAREWARSGRIGFGRFYLRRFQRLTPALALMVAVTVLVSAFVLSPLGPQQTAAQTGIGALFLVANAVIATTTGGYFDAPAETNVLLHTWSLSVEEQFYLVFPLLLMVGWSVARRRAHRHTRLGPADAQTGSSTQTGSSALAGSSVVPILIVAGVAVVSFAAALAGSAGYRLPQANWLLGFYSPLTRAWEFAVGALLALGAARLSLTSRRAATGVGVIGGGLLLASLWVIDGQTPFPGVATLLPVLGTAALILAGTHAGNPVSQLLSRSGMVTVGDWSYSIYLWHWPAIVIATVLWPQVGTLATLIAAVVSLAPAVGSYYLVEQPFRARPLVPGWQLARTVGAVVTPPLVLAASAWLVADAYWAPKVSDVDSVIASAGQDGQAGQDRQAGQAGKPDAAGQPGAAGAVGGSEQEHIVYVRGCWYDEDSGDQDPDPCRWHEDAPGTPVYLAGDSHAAALADGLVEATATVGRPLTVTAASACPLIDVGIVTSTRGSYEQACQQHTRRTLSWLSNQPAGTVMLAATDNYWLNSQHGVRLPDGSQTQRTADKLAAVRTALIREVRQLRQAGHEVVLVQTVPSFRGEYAWAPERCSLASTLRGCVQQMPLEAANARSAPVRQMLIAVAEASGAQVVDLGPAVCRDGTCVTGDEAGPWYADESHLSVEGSLRLAPVFADLLD